MHVPLNITSHAIAMCERSGSCIGSRIPDESCLSERTTDAARAPSGERLRLRYVCNAMRAHSTGGYFIAKMIIRIVPNARHGQVVPLNEPTPRQVVPAATPAFAVPFVAWWHVARLGRVLIA